MRRRFCTLSMILFSGCIVITFHGSGGAQKSSVAAAVLAIRNQLTRLRNDIPVRRAQLHPIACGAQTCYARSEVRTALAKIRSDARSAFPEAALASRLALDEELAVAVDRLAATRSAPSIELVRNGRDRSVPLVQAREADAAFDAAKAPIDTYLAHKELNPTIRVRSDPSGARFRMRIGTNETTAFEAATQGDLQSVWRGRYTGTMTKKGYRDVAAFPIDLFHDSRTVVRCTLVRTDAPANDESICRLEN